ncbi:2OG-Fe(II) oxygenase [Tistrella bauzanensis]|uniref:2OG-Fe(II) oxygenase n=1 Tax=Tistrella TaxID=171436 RepID=UPI0031FA8CB7
MTTTLETAMPTAADAIAGRTGRIDWAAVATALDRQGSAILPGLLVPDDCATISGLYPDDSRFRSHVVMARHGFGQGAYKYFARPLPDLVAALRGRIYPHLAAIANGWAARMGLDDRYPDDHASFLARCHAAGQIRPTPLLLEYGPGDYNCLHQDLYGALAFPLQLAVLLSRPGTEAAVAAGDADFSGGEFVLTEQRPRMQSRAEVVPLGQGDAVVFAVNQRPVRGTRGDYRVTMRHGVSRVRAGRRHTLGIIFHDAQ